MRKIKGRDGKRALRVSLVRRPFAQLAEAGVANLDKLAEQAASALRNVKLVGSRDRHRVYVGYWQCAPKARITSGGGFHPESCRLIW